jgi:hypothetical protein
MEMVKYLALATALVCSLVLVNLVEAGHRHHRRGGHHGHHGHHGGCSGGACYAAPVHAEPVYSGCPGGVCGAHHHAAYSYSAPVGYAYSYPVRVQSTVVSRPATSAPVVVNAPVVQSAPQYYYTSGGRRGLFGRR